MDKAINNLPLGEGNGANWKEKARLNSGIGFGLPTTGDFDQEEPFDFNMIAEMPDEIAQEMLDLHFGSNTFAGEELNIVEMVKAAKPNKRKNLLKGLTLYEVNRLPKALRLEALRLKNDNKMTYIGIEDQDKLMHGVGAMVSADGQSLYEGHFIENLRDGIGRLFKLSSKGDYISVTEGAYKSGVGQGQFKETRFFYPTANNKINTITREYEAQDG